MHLILLVVLFLGLTHGLSLFSLANDEWELYKAMYGKKYPSVVEERFRMKIFLENKHAIIKHNRAHEEHGYELAVNEFADMLPYEFSSRSLGLRMDFGNSTERLLLAATFIEPNSINIPHSIDWREEGAVTPVKNQLDCGSCWAFSATGALEGQEFRKTGKLVSLSEQNLVDCSAAYGNQACEGGLMDFAFKYIKENHGIDTEDGYPYEGKVTTCRYKESTKGGEAKGYVDLPPGNEQKLQSAVATVGPISIAIDASHNSFQFYSKGVYYERSCSSDELDHGVLVVGYGTEDGKDYWLVKNSWGLKWGEEGYVKMARNRNNHCGVATAASYPIV